MSCINNVYFDFIKKEIHETNFVALQADDTTDVSCKSQLVIILRYIKHNSTVERFLGFYDISDMSAKGLGGVIQANIDIFKFKDKLIAQTYDGAAVMIFFFS